MILRVGESIQVLRRRLLWLMYRIEGHIKEKRFGLVSLDEAAGLARDCVGQIFVLLYRLRPAHQRIAADSRLNVTVSAAKKAIELIEAAPCRQIRLVRAF